MKIRELPILARIDPKTPKRRAATKKCCGWEKPAIYGKMLHIGSKVMHKNGNQKILKIQFLALGKV